jgi:hypothetical protein
VINVFDYIINKFFSKPIIPRKQGTNYIFNRADTFFNCPNCNVKGNLGLEPIISLILVCPRCDKHYEIIDSRFNMITRKVSIDLREISPDDMKDVKKLFDPTSGVQIGYDKVPIGDSDIKLNKLKRDSKQYGDKTNFDI